MTRITTALRCSFILFLLSVFSSGGRLAGQETFVCVWRNPERTMTRLFPEAKDYTSRTSVISAELRAGIEKALGEALLPGQEREFPYYVLNGEKGEIGYLIAGSQRGGYGALEFVFGMDKSGRIIGIYIQRSRERDTGFRQKAFLDRFLGLTPEDWESVKGMKHDGSPGQKALIRGVAKELLVFRRLVQGEIRGER